MSTAEHAETNRRDFLYIATGAVGAVGAALTVWPFINQMNPDASVLALASVEVDLAPIAEGQEITIKWRGNPVFIRHRLPAEIEAAKAVHDGRASRIRWRATPMCPKATRRPTSTAWSAARNSSWS